MARRRGVDGLSEMKRGGARGAPTPEDEPTEVVDAPRPPAEEGVLPFATPLGRSVSAYFVACSVACPIAFT